MSMTEEFKNAIEGLKSAREMALAKVSGWSEEQLNFKPRPESWCAIQIFQHIMFSEGGTFGYVLKKTSSGWEGLDVVGKEEKASGERLVNRLATKEKFAAPPVLPEPPGDENFENLKSRWDELYAKLIPFFEDMDEAFYDRLVFKQPAAGMVTPLVTIQFLTKHIEHHFMQLDELKAAMK